MLRNAGTIRMMSTQILATERFARVGKSIHEVGEQQEELQKKRIDGSLA